MAGLPLEGTLVVSLEQAVAAPYCSSRLADAGARVQRRTDGLDAPRQHVGHLAGEDFGALGVFDASQTSTLPSDNPTTIRGSIPVTA